MDEIIPKIIAQIYKVLIEDESSQEDDLSLSGSNFFLLKPTR